MNLQFDLGIHCQYLIPVESRNIQTLENQFIGIKSGVIVHVGPYKPKLRAQCRKMIRGDHHVVLPGLINGHTHLAMTLFRGLEDDVPLKTWLFERIFPLEASLVNSNFVRLGTELAALECIRFGTTTVNEMYFFAEVAAGAWDKAGLRGIFSQPIIGFPIPEDKELGTDKELIIQKLVKKYQSSSRIKIGVAPHAPYTCDDELLKKASRIAQDYSLPLHIHVSETKFELEDSKAKFGKSPIQRLADLGILNSQVRCAHMVHLEEADFTILQKSGASVIYNPDSNMKLSSGIAPVTRFQELNIPISLGTDGSASKNDLSLFGAMNIGTKLQKVASSNNTSMIADQALYMATLGGAQALGLENEIGSIEIGKKADLIFVDLNYPHFHPIHNLSSHLVYSATGLEISTVICEGKVLFHKNKWTSLNYPKIIKQVGVLQKQIDLELKTLRAQK